MQPDATATVDELGPASTLAEIVRAAPGSARVFEDLALDYCCGGNRSLAASCASRSLDPLDVLATVRSLESGPAPDWATLGPAGLVDHLEATHHAYLHAELPRLSRLTAKVLVAHGRRHPELAEVERAYAAVRADLEPHLMKEERILFPMVRELDGASAAPAFHCGSLRNPISVMLREHDAAGALLSHLRDVTGGYVVPSDACASYRALYEGYAQLEADTHLHVHKENSVLFPMVVRLEEQLASAAR